MKRNRSSHRHAVTLVELLVVIAASSIILTTSAALMHRIMQTQKKSQAFFDVERSGVRLSDQFRRDVNAASSATIDAEATGEKPFLLLQLASGQTIEYRHGKGIVLRLQPREGSVASREEYSIPTGAELKISEAESPRRLVLSIIAEPNVARGDGARSGDPHAMPMYLSVEARLNRVPPIVAEKVSP
jgi:hypothetical protein